MHFEQEGKEDMERATISRREFVSIVSAVAAGGALPAFAGSGDGEIAAAFVKGSDFARDANKLAAQVRAAGCRIAIVDVQDYAKYPSHPEIATRNSLSPGKIAAAVSKMKAAGVDVVPLLDFASSNDAWLGEYDRMVCSKKYDAVVHDLVRDAYEVFGRPRYIHIGFERDGRNPRKPEDGLVIVRQGDLWMRNFIKVVDWVKGAGARAWAWFDYPWGLGDFLADCPKDVIYTNFRPLAEAKTGDQFMQTSKSKVADQFATIAKKGCLVVPLVKDDNEAAAFRSKVPAGNFLGTMKEVSL